LGRISQHKTTYDASDSVAESGMKESAGDSTGSSSASWLLMVRLLAINGNQKGRPRFVAITYYHKARARQRAHAPIFALQTCLLSLWACSLQPN